VNWPSVENTEWEIYLSRQSTSLETSGLFVPPETPPTDLDITYLQAGGTYWFEGERARPYIVATVGLSRFEPDESSFDSETFFAFGIGVVQDRAHVPDRPAAGSGRVLAPWWTATRPSSAGLAVQRAAA
jgi:hypothetical protein